MPRLAHFLETAAYRGKVRSFLPLRQRPDARSSQPAHPRAPAVRRSIRPRPPRQRPQFSASFPAGSRSNHTDQPVDVALGVIQVRGDANVPFAQTYDNIFLPKMMVMFRRFLRASRRTTSVRAAPRRIERTRRHKAIFRQTLV